MIFADLHAHTTASDGSLTPTELVQAALEVGLSYLAVTDHDTTAGVEEAIRAARGTKLSIVPGVELSADGPPGKCHLLGLGIDYRHDELNQTLARLSEHRRTRNQKILDRLTALGKPVTMDEVIVAAPQGANIGRPHIAEVMVRKGYVADLRIAFQNYLRDGGPANVEKETLTPADAIRLIHVAGGFCCLAHPGLLRLEKHETDERRILALKGLDMDGLEVYYPKHTYAQSGRFLRLAEKHRLMVTGGADFHGTPKPEIRLGYVRYEQRLPAEAVSKVLLDRALTGVPGEPESD